MQEAPESTKAVAGIHWLTNIGTCNKGDILNAGESKGDEDEGLLLVLWLLWVTEFKVTKDFDLSVWLNCVQGCLGKREFEVTWKLGESGETGGSGGFGGFGKTVFGRFFGSLTTTVANEQIIFLRSELKDESSGSCWNTLDN